MFGLKEDKVVEEVPTPLEVVPASPAEALKGAKGKSVRVTLNDGKIVEGVVEDVGDLQVKIGGSQIELKRIEVAVYPRS